MSARILSTSVDGDSSASNDCMNKKLRNLGDDEVHIVWSEHYRNRCWIMNKVNTYLWSVLWTLRLLLLLFLLFMLAASLDSKI